jgi:hypothetical protein
MTGHLCCHFDVPYYRGRPEEIVCQTASYPAQGRRGFELMEGCGRGRAHTEGKQLDWEFCSCLMGQVGQGLSLVGGLG